MVSVMKAVYVCMDYDRYFAIYIGHGSHKVGIVIHDWGWRLMLVWWHICGEWPRFTKERQGTAPNMPSAK